MPPLAPTHLLRRRLAASRRGRLSGRELAARLATAQRIPPWLVDDWLDPRDLQAFKQCHRHLRVRITGPLGLRRPVPAAQPAGPMQHLGEGVAVTAFLPGGWLVPADMASTAEQRSGRDVLGESMLRMPHISPRTSSPLPHPEPSALFLAPTLVPSAARTRGLRNAPLGRQLETGGVSPGASSSTSRRCDAGAAPPPSAVHAGHVSTPGTPGAPHGDAVSFHRTSGAGMT